MAFEDISHFLNNLAQKNGAGQPPRKKKTQFGSRYRIPFLPQHRLVSIGVTHQAHDVSGVTNISSISQVAEEKKTHQQSVQCFPTIPKADVFQAFWEEIFPYFLPPAWG